MECSVLTSSFDDARSTSANHKYDQPVSSSLARINTLLCSSMNNATSCHLLELSFYNVSFAVLFTEGNDNRRIT